MVSQRLFMPLLIAVVGSHHSGKTTTIEYLVSRLTKEGFSVGTIKHIHHEFTIDKQGTNTWRHMQAGSKVTVAVAPHEISIIKKVETHKYTIDEVISLLNNENLDFIFLEGFQDLINNKADLLRIVAAKDFQDLKETLAKINSPILAITGLITKQQKDYPNLSVPFIKLPEQGNQLFNLIKQTNTPQK
ncbi:MAG: molybdopterin-guanine dinucleotide biosynthesis protein B [Crenarchaeota archaeon]|nr:molybdopterin-guanine dinucleotide biosynthesis protein B [Thermoproteota archaeon]